MFCRLFSNRYNRKREIFYAEYEEARQRFPNLPVYRRPEEPSGSHLPKCHRKKRQTIDYDHDDWISGHFVSIVVRRTIERWSRSQLMEAAPTNRGNDACSWRSWPGDDANFTEPRRSQRLQAAKPNLKLSQMATTSQPEGARGTAKWAEQQTLTFIDGAAGLECSMCCMHFGQNGDLQLHSLDDCRKYLLATLAN